MNASVGHSRRSRRGEAAERKLKVLLVSLYHPELMRGGAQQACYELFLGLNAEPDVEAYFLAGTEAKRYPALYRPGACITGFEGRPNEFLFLTPEYDFRWQRTLSPRHVEAYAALLETIRPDVVHFQHFLFLGIDLLTLTRHVLPGCRIIFTLHDYLTMCDAWGHMVRLTDGSLCDRPSPVRCHQCFPDRAPDDFLLRKMWFSRHLAVVDRFASACRFQIEHHVDWGLDRNKIFHVPTGQVNRAPAELPPARQGGKNRFGFFGQYVNHKGVDVIFKAVQVLRGQGFTDFRVELNGDNIRVATPGVRQELEAFLAEEKARPPSQRNVFDNGSYHADQIGERMLRIDWSLVPSTWWESFGLVITEAWMFKRPVICSNIGGMAERVAHEVNGLHFQVGDPSALAETMQRAATEAGLWERLSAATPEPHSREDYVKAYRALYEEDDLTPPDPLRRESRKPAVAASGKPAASRKPEAAAPSPLFIVGSPRSGTTILTAALLGAGYHGYLEGNLLSLWQMLRERIEWYFRLPFAQQERTLMANIRPEAFRDSVREIFKRQLDELNEHSPWLDKTCNAETILAIPDLIAMWPSCRIFCARRRGIENVLSRLKKFPAQDFQRHCRDWTRAMSAWRQVRDTLEPWRYLEVEQRDLVVRPQAVSHEIAGLLALNEGARIRIERTFARQRHQETAPGTAERLVSLAETSWTEQEIGQFLEICGPEMDAYGYSLDDTYWKDVAARS